MKQFVTTVLLGLGLCRAALAGNSPITPVYYNYGLVGNPAPEVDAIGFFNQGTFQISTVASVNLTNVRSVFGLGEDVYAFATKDTLFFTNAASGLLLGTNGFDFETIGPTSIHPASLFLNQGVVAGVDTWFGPYIYSVPGSTVFVAVPEDSQTIPSQLTVSATNIINAGAMSVGNAGMLALTGHNVTNAFGTLAAGSLNTAGVPPDPLDTSGIQGQDDWEPGGVGQYFFVGSPGVYDLSWGITNGDTLDTAALSEELPYGIPNVTSGARGVDGFLGNLFGLGLNENAEYITNSWLYQEGTNVYYTIAFVNTNFSNTNITATVGFSESAELQFVGTIPAPLLGAPEIVVQIAEPVFDVITGHTVTNGIYLIDTGAILPSMSLEQNASVAETYERPNAFELTTITPPEWADAVFTNVGYFSDYVYFQGIFNNYKEALEISDYGAQIGHNPSSISGSFSSLVDTNTDAYDVLYYDSVNLLDPTNEPGRIQINAGNLDINQQRIRAEGIVELNATNLIGSSAAVDWGEANATIGVTNGYLSISNVFPTNFQRIRGDIFAASASWQNTQTNPNYYFTGSNGQILVFPGTTNQWYYHVLVVDQDLFGSFTPTVRNLTLTGKNSIVLQDSLNVINQAVFNTTNLIVNSSNYFGQSAQNFTPATTPYMKNLFINTNGFLGSDNLLDVGFNVDHGQAAPAGRTYTVNTITNYGQILSPAPLLQAAIIEVDGRVTANNSGSILLEASNLDLGLALPNVTNRLLADGSVNLSAITIQARNSTISAGLAEPASLVLNATAQLTDFVPGIPSTNTNSVITNHWTVTGGFMMENKPATGDLYGTEIHTIATGVQYVTHVWAATDWSNNIANGFTDNEVIGRLVLDRRSNGCTLHFSAAGARNAIYVDYLELTNFATNYHEGIAIDPNMAIYFAGANADPQKLQEIYTNLIWVTNFVGPNSTFIVPYLPTNSGLFCLMNTNVATSTEISFWDGILNYYFVYPSPGNFDPYLLNGPGGTNFRTCPGTYSFPCVCTPGTNEYQLLYTNISTIVTATSTNLETNLDVLTVSYNGQGSITPMLTQSQLVLSNTYTLTAKPASGWVFDYWTITEMSGVTNTNFYSPVLTFAFVTNTLVTANFIPVPFPELAGVYDGLFFETNAVDPGSSGAVTLTLAKTGAFSGKLLMGPATYTFASQFTGAGAAQFQATSGKQSLAVNLQLDITNFSGEIMGNVIGSNWDAVLEANLAPAWTSKNPSPLAGAYTMSLPWASGTETNEPGGDSYGAGKVSDLGVLTLAGALSDGATFSVAAPVFTNGQWPLYIYAAASNDTVLGWLTVSSKGLNGTNISWSRASRAGTFYPAGFTNVLQLIGSTWQAPAKSSVSLSLTNPVVALSGGNLSGTYYYGVKLENALAFGSTNLSLSVNSSTGVFTGSFHSPVNGKQVKIFGVILTSEGVARGFFLSPDDSGAVILEGQ